MFFRAADSSGRSTFLRELTGGLFSVIFPSPCVLCGEPSGASPGGVCSACWSGIQSWAGAACQGCGLPFAAAPAEADPTLCSVCRRGDYAFDLARSFGVYSGVLRAAILQLKFYRRESLGWRLGALLAPLWDWLGESGRGRPSLLVPVPLYRARERERGFNQAELLCRGFLAALRVSRRGGPLPRLETGCLRRQRPTQSQSGLTLEKRLENVRGAFGVEAPDRLQGREVLLVDDVMTTGATASASAGALKRGGAASVVVLTVARATPQFPVQVARSHGSEHE